MTNKLCPHGKTSTNWLRSFKSVVLQYKSGWKQTSVSHAVIEEEESQQIDGSHGHRKRKQYQTKLPKMSCMHCIVFPQTCGLVISGSFLLKKYYHDNSKILNSYTVVNYVKTNYYAL